MNKKYVYLLSGVLLVFVALQSISCKKADIKFGEEFLDNNITQIYKVDSFSVNLSTIQQDSFITSSSSNIMLGAYTDPYFGRITTQAYFEIAPPAWSDVYQNTYFDSVVLILKTNGTYYGDTTLPVTINVNQLQDSILFTENTYALYNNSKFKAMPNVLGSFTGIIAPRSKQTISIKLPDTLGVSILNKLKDVNDNPVKSAANFLGYFKGLQLNTTATTNAIVNCSDDAVVRIYYRQNGMTTEFKSVDFHLGNKTHQFNNISYNRIGTALQNLATAKELPSSATNNVVYVQSITNCVAKLSFPTLKELWGIKNFAKVLKATLIIKPIKGSYSTTYFLPPSLRLSKTDVNNKIGLDLAYVNSNGVLATQVGNLQVDYFANENTQYQYDLTEYVKNVINSSTPVPGDGLLLSAPSPDFSTNFSRAVIGDNANAYGRIQLQIFYATIN